MARKQEIPLLKIAGIALAGIFGLRLFKGAVEKAVAKQPVNTDGVQSSGSGTNVFAGVSSPVTVNTVLAKGSKGDMVALLQQTINGFLPSKYTKLVVDGKFGAKTETALLTFWGVPSASVQYIRDKGVTTNISVYNGSGGSTGSTPKSFQELYDQFYSPGAGEDTPAEKPWYYYLTAAAWFTN